MNARERAVEVMARAFYAHDTWMPDCWETDSDGARGWYRDMSSAALDALLSCPAGCDHGTVTRPALAVLREEFIPPGTADENAPDIAADPAWGDEVFRRRRSARER